MYCNELQNGRIRFNIFSMVINKYDPRQIIESRHNELHEWTNNNIVKIKNQHIDPHLKQYLEILLMRMYKEFVFLTSKKQNYNSIEFIVYKNYDIDIFVNNKCHVYKFSVKSNEQFPFTPPTVYIDNAETSIFFHFKSDRFRNQLKYICDAECLCCGMCICPIKWCVYHKLGDSLDELTTNAKYRHYVVIKVLVDLIKEKYLNTDIPIFEWLFVPKQSVYHLLR